MRTDPALRHRWAAELLDPAPSDSILEIGCGHGLATGLVCEKLSDGHLTAIDRSEKMAQACRKRNAGAIAAGKLTVVAATFEDSRFPAPFDKAFAVNVDFPLHNDERWALHFARVLKPGGALVLVGESPAAATAERFSREAKAALAAVGFAAEIIAGAGMVAVRAIR